MITLEKKQCLIAGDGQLPVKMVQYAKDNGFDVYVISFSEDNYRELKKYSDRVVSFGPGQISKIKDFLLSEGIKQVTFLGKVNKSMLLKRPFLDTDAIRILKEMPRLNDDAIMLEIVNQLEDLGVTVLDQTIFIKNCMVPRGVLTTFEPDEAQKADIEYGYKIAKEMGKLDIGQSVVIKDRMIMAVEAIEGTDKCIKRGAKLARKGAVIVKVAKPQQDKRFDIPAVGLRTLKVMRKYKAKVLALESGETIILDLEKVVKFANKHKIIVASI